MFINKLDIFNNILIWNAKKMSFQPEYLAKVYINKEKMKLQNWLLTKIYKNQEEMFYLWTPCMYNFCLIKFWKKNEFRYILSCVYFSQKKYFMQTVELNKINFFVYLRRQYQERFFRDKMNTFITILFLVIFTVVRYQKNLQIIQIKPYCFS